MPRDLKKITVNLSPRAQRALDEIEDLEGENQTDAVNRALPVYALLLKAIRQGKDLALIPPGGQPEVIHVL